MTAIARFGPDMIAGIDRSNRTQYRYHLVKRWLAAMPQVVESLRAGAEITGEAGLDAVLREIDTRLEVELAKLEMRAGRA